MSTIAGMYYMRTPGTTTPAAQDIQPSSECSEMDPEPNLNRSEEDEDDNTSCSASEMGCDLSLSTTSHNNNNKDSSSPSSFSSSRKNKRKNFKPRNILEYAGSDEEEHHHHSTSSQSGLKGRNYVNSSRRPVHQITPGDDGDEEEEEDDDDTERLNASEGSDKRNGIMDMRMEMGESQGRHSILMNGRRKVSDDEEEDGDSDDYTSNIRRDPDRRTLGSGGPSDGPLDLSEVQNESNKPLWHSSKDKSRSMRSPPSPHSVHSLLNNNVLDPAAFLHGQYSHHNSFLSMGLSPSQAAVAAAAAAMGMGMDLRMAGGGGGRNAEGLLYESESRSNDNAISSSTTHTSSSISNNNNNLSTNNNHHHALQGLGSSLHPNPHHQPSASVLNDFAENTMKELLSLYGIAENFRQAGGKSAELLNMHGSLDTPSGHPSKMMLPENMARLLAAMQESVNNAAGSHHHHQQQHHLSNPIDHSTQSSQSSVTSNSKGNHHHQQHSSHHPLNFANINTLVQQPLVSSAGSPVRSPSSAMNGGGITNSNGGIISSGGANSLSGGGSLNLRGDGGSNGSSSNNGHLFSHKPKSRSSQGRGLTSFPVIREGLLGKGTGPVDYTRYVRRFSNAVECGYGQCRELNYREHFHCQECSDGTRVFVKKEEMIRHFKWHKKRDESLQHGFMRYSPMDDCSDKFPNCSHNRKQTHYHCLKDGCEKVYISTSDVQMHANYHRKDSAIIQEGFQRFRAAEDCGSEHCTFRHQKTTHFHCRRPTCSFTFKNKADMEKHKSYHIKDEQLNRDGFKKFMKHEECQYPNCRFSRVCNHIHCIREGCNYVLHSSGQLYSHKRKHERRDAELAYRKYKLAQSLMKGTFGPDFASLNESLLLSIKSEEENSRSSLNDGLPATPTPANVGTDGESGAEEGIKKFIQLCNCDVTQQEHFHCKVDSCLNALLGSLEVAAEHGKNHELEDKISSLAYFTVDPANFDAQDSTIPCISAKCPYQTREKHYHCLWDGCSEVILATDEPFKRLEHFRVHQHTQKMEIVGDKGEGPVGEAMDGFFRRKRGRPPKNRVIEVSSGANEAIYTSFKLPKPSIPGLGGDGMDDFDSKDPIGFVSYPEGASCPDPSCPYHESSSTCHYHCGHPRCHFSVSDVHKLSNHLREFHSSCDVLENYEYFDRNSNCNMKMCPFDGSSDHFHCTRDNFSCSKHLEIMAHESECHEGKSGSSSDDDGASDSKRSGNGASVKASGTFYPTHTLDKTKITFNGGERNNPMDLSSPNGTHPDSGSESKSVTDHSLSRILQIPSSGDNGETQYGPEAACGRPFCKLKRKHHFHCHLCNQAFSELEKLRPHVLKHSNVSPSKIPDSEHSTDDEGSLAIQTPEDNLRSSPHLSNKLRSSPSSSESAGPLPSHSFPKFDPFPSSSLSNFLSYPGAHSPYLFLQQNPLTSLYAGMMFGGSGGSVTAGTGGSASSPSFPLPQSGGPASHLRGTTSPPAAAAAAAAALLSTTPEAVSPCTPQSIKRPPSASPSSPASPSEAKKARMQMRILKDEPVPEGYIRFRFNEDCAYVHCGYREHQTHFHCTREDCGYSFCDKTRFVQHTARHERLDTLMGGDFKQFRANVSCGRTDCAYKTAQGVTQAQNKASHFHCSKCEFVCTDTNKVVAHRRQHQKLDSIMAAGFEKFTPSQNCQIEGCIHSLKQTHYHCLKCGYAVLGLSQMSAHKYRHVD